MCFLSRAARLQQKNAQIQKDKKESRSLLKKRTKDSYFLRRPRLSGQIPYLCASAEPKVFWFFSSEKNILPLSH
jgi:hypothetical protein